MLYWSVKWHVLDKSIYFHWSEKIKNNTIEKNMSIVWEATAKRAWPYLLGYVTNCQPTMSSSSHKSLSLEIRMRQGSWDEAQGLRANRGSGRGTQAETRRRMLLTAPSFHPQLMTLAQLRTVKDQKEKRN